MKPRDIFVIILMVGATGGLVWWMWQPSAEELAAAKTTAHADGSNASSDGTGMAGSAKSAGRNAVADNDSMKSANDTADVSSTDDPSAADKTKSTDDGMAASTAANPGGDPTASGQGTTKAANGKGLHFAAGPDGGADVALTGLSQQAERSAAFAGRLGNINALRFRSPLPIYSISSSDITNGTLENAQAVSRFYYPVESAGQLVTGELVVVSATPDNQPFGVSQPAGIQSAGTSSSGPAINAALDQLTANDQVSAGSYEARLLVSSDRIGTILPVIWLKSDVGGADLIYKLPPYNPNQTFLNAADYLKTLLPPAN